MERSNRWREMMSRDGDLKFLLLNLVLVKIKTYMLLTDAKILMNCAAHFCQIVSQGGNQLMHCWWSTEILSVMVLLGWHCGRAT